MLGCMHLPRELEPFHGWGPGALEFEAIVGETDLEGIVSSIAQIRLEQAGKLAVDRQQDEPAAVALAVIEVIPPAHARQPRHELRRPIPERVETPVSP